MSGGISMQGVMTQVPDVSSLKAYQRVADAPISKDKKTSIKVFGGVVSGQDYVKLGSRSAAYKAENNAARMDFLNAVCKVYGFQTNEKFGTDKFKDELWAFAKGENNLPKNVKDVLKLRDYKTFFHGKFETGRPLTGSRIRKVWNAINADLEAKDWQGIRNLIAASGTNGGVKSGVTHDVANSAGGVTHDVANSASGATTDSEFNPPQTFNEVEKLANKDELKFVISGQSAEKTTFAKYLVCFRPRLRGRTGKREVEAFLSRFSADDLDMSDLTIKWSNGSIPKRTDQCIFDCFQSNPESPLFKDRKYDALFSSSDAPNQDQLKKEFLEDLKALKPIPKPSDPKNEQLKTGVVEKQQQSNSVSKSKDSAIKDAMKKAKQDDALKLQYISNKTEKNNSEKNKNGGKIQEQNLSKAIYIERPTNEKVEEPPKQWEPSKYAKKQDDIHSKQLDVVDKKLLVDLGGGESDWKGIPKDISKLGFKTFMMCWLDKNGDQQGILTNFKKDTFNKLAAAFDSVCTDEEVADKINQKVDKIAGDYARNGGNNWSREKGAGEVFVERYSALPENSPVIQSLKALTDDKVNVNVDQFKAALKEALLA